MLIAYSLCHKVPDSMLTAVLIWVEHALPPDGQENRLVRDLDTNCLLTMLVLVHDF